MHRIERRVRTALQFALACCLGTFLCACRTVAPIHVWHPSPVQTPANARIALAPLAGDRELAARIEAEMLGQRPAVKADVALFTAEQLVVASPVRFASTAALTSDVAAIQAARNINADLLLQGEILSSDLDLETTTEETKPEKANFNEQFFARTDRPKLKNRRVLLSWRVIDVESAQTIGTHAFNLSSKQAAKNYPDLEVSRETETDLVVAAAAREMWQAISPIVVKDKVRLARPWLTPGSIRVQLGNRAAKQGQWAAAEMHWRTAARWFPFNAAAQHNLAIALAAREDFPAAKQQFEEANGLLSYRLPHETLFWLDQNHRRYVEAHGLPKPAGGWSFPEPQDSLATVPSAPAENLDDMPWWTAIPLTKPPGWTWQEWLTQPWVF